MKEKQHKQFKAFDKVLVREGGIWTPDIYSRYSENKNKHWCISFGWLDEDNIITYEGNEGLVGTTDEPEEEIKLEEGEFIMVADINIISQYEWTLKRFAGVFKCKFKANALDEATYNWRYAIRFSDFNPNDMEETRKHIMCVRNGRIVRYKE